MREANQKDVTKRDPVKWVRDAVKSNYIKDDHCQICNVGELLEFHHYYAVAEMYSLWVKNKKYSAADVLEHRHEFIAEHQDQLLHKCVTLCKADHARLHKIYGKSPKLLTAEKQVRWVEKQRLKKLE